MNSLIETLEEYGLNAKEAKIYVTALALGSAPASSIARNANEKKSTAYSILKELAKKGLASEVKNRNSTYFSMVSPECILLELEKKYNRFKEQLPDLMSLIANNGPKAKAEFFEGMEGVKIMYDDLLTSKIEMLSFLGIEHTDPVLLNYLYKDFLVRRIKKNIFAKVILSDSARNRQYAGIDKKAKKESKVVAKKYFTLDAGIDLYGPNKVQIVLLNDNEIFGLRITSQKLYTTLVSIFQFIWDHA